VIIQNKVLTIIGPSSVHLAIKDGRQRHQLQDKLFGTDQTVEWFKQIFGLLQQLRMANKAPKRNTLLYVIFFMVMVIFRSIYT
jgi:hypothetical protein